MIILCSIHGPDHSFRCEIRLMLLQSSEMVKKVEPQHQAVHRVLRPPPTAVHQPLQYAYDIVTEVDHPLVGITLDQYHFHAMASGGLLSRRLTAEDFVAPERHGEYAVRLLTMTRSVCGRASRATASTTSVMQIPSRRSALKATFAPWSVPSDYLTVQQENIKKATGARHMFTEVPGLNNQ